MKKFLKLESAQGAIANIAGMVVGMLNTMWLLPLLFTVEEIGFYRWIERTAMFLAQVGLFGLHRVYIKYHNALDPAERRGLLNQILTAVLGISGIFMVLVLVFHSGFSALMNVADYSNNLWLLGIMTIGILWYFLGASISSTVGAIRRPFVWRALGLRVALLLSGALVYFGVVGFISWAILQVIFALVVGVGILLWSLKLVDWKPQGPWRYSGSERKEMRVFGAFNTLNSFLTFALNTVDVQFIIYFLGVGSVGVYSIASFIALFVDGIKRPLSQSAIAQFAKFWNDRNFTGLQSYYKRTTLVITIVAVAAFVGIVPQLELLFSFIPDGDRFEAAKPLVVFLLLARVIDYSVGYNGEVLANGPHYRSNLYLSGAMLVLLIVANSLLIPQMGLLGAPVSFLVVNSTFNIIKAAYLYFKEGWHPFSWMQLKVIASGALVYMLSMMYNATEPLDLIIRAGALGLWGLWVLKRALPKTQ